MQEQLPKLQPTAMPAPCHLRRFQNMRISSRPNSWTKYNIIAVSPPTFPPRGYNNYHVNSGDVVVVVLENCDRVPMKQALHSVATRQ